MSESRVPRKEFVEIEYEENVKRQEEEGEPNDGAGTAKPTSKKSEKPDQDEWEQYRGFHEPEEHWLLRKEFLKRNAGAFDKNRLLSLSQAFANMEFLGCKYPIETMELVAELSGGIVDEYREAKRGRIQRTFVKASDAAERKTKGKNSTSRDERKNDSSHSHMVEHSKVRGGNHVPSVPSVSSKNVALQSILGLHQRESGAEAMETESAIHKSSQQMETDDGKAKYPIPDDIDIALRKSFDAIKLFSTSAAEVLKNVDKTIATVSDFKSTMDMLKTLYIMETVNDSNEVTILTQSFSMCHKNEYLHFDFPPYTLSQGVNMRCNIIIGPAKKIFLTIHGEGKGQKEAKRDACVKGLKVFKQLRPVIKIKQVSNRVVDRSEICPTKKPSVPPVSKPSMDTGTNSFAMKMMLKMGWKGGGLGRNEDGILQPVPEPVAHNTRLGLGNYRDSSVEFEENVTELLRMEQETLFSLSSDVEFATDFSKGERKLIHNIAQKLGFTSKSYGQGENRHLVISRKTDPEQLFREVINAGGETPKYKVILPDCWQT